MLDGTKPVCILTFPHNREKIEPLLEAVKEERLHYQKTPIPGEENCFFYTFCQLGKEKDMQELLKLNIDMLEGQIPANKFYHQRMGELLGYPKEDIRKFNGIANRIERRTSGIRFRIKNGFTKLGLLSKPEPPQLDFTPLPDP